ncbi:hypothetical protein KKH30_04215, partial [Candidatus Micrarchaeota archaeon]|nr:hypothetical protein [Candidatus Micrarchaeota archaeon]MBU1939943.1 hypothetical protein [Candidatus Micrarchaeota archaeon]
MGWKLKVFPACLALIVLACSVHAEITIVSPYEATIPQGANFNLGSAQPGETVKIIISSSSGVSGLPWTSAELTAVPPGWKTGAISQGGKTLLLTAEIPKDARQNAYNLSILLSNTRGEPAAEEFSARLFVENGLLRTSVTQQKTSTLVNEAVPYT